MDSDEEDFLFFGTPIEREEEITNRRKKAAAEASGQLRSAPPWKQEVLDEEGRRRFHGAFTGGFSAGYYNTVGSKEGWTPQSFTSSRKNRAEVKQQSIFSFLDEDEKVEMEGQFLGTSSKFDTFGFTAAEYARKQAETEQKQRPSAIPGPVPDELVAPVTESIGVKLLMKMGWRRGRSIKDSHASSIYDARREARKAFLAFADDGKVSQLADSEPVESELGSLIEQPVNDAVWSSQSTTDIYASGYNFEETYVQEDEEQPSSLHTDDKKKLVWKEQGVLPGFKVATNSDYQPERFNPPVIPKDFVPHHKFPGPLETEKKLAISPCPEVPPPDDNNLKILIEGVATLVARCGRLFEDLSREKNQSNPLFSFLSGGNGREYYARKLWEEHQKRDDQTKLSLDGKLSPSMKKMTADSRGKLLGEKPLERSSRDISSTSVTSGVSVNLQHDLSNTFTKPELFNALPEVAKPFKDDPAKQERFERFLKEKYQGGLRSTDSGAASNMSEAARARERLDFEAAAEAIEKGKQGKESNISLQPFVEFSATGGLKFTSGGSEVKDTQAEDSTVKKIFPRREEFQWRPSPILCKRFDLIDPFMGKPPPAPRMRSKMDSLDSLIFMADSVKATKLGEDVTINRDLPPSQNNSEKITEKVAEQEVKVEVENVERPVDLYKAIFSDDSDDEVDSPNNNKVGDPEKKVEAATTALNRLIAGDFLESLGKELGLEVPPDVPLSTSKSMTPAQKATPNAEALTAKFEDTSSSTLNALGASSINQGVPVSEDASSEHTLTEIELNLENSLRNGSQQTKDVLSKDRDSKVDLEKMAQEDRKDKTSSRHRRNWSNSPSSEDERSRKRSRRHRNRSSDSYSDSSPDSFSDHQGHNHSRSRRKKKSSSREKSGGSRKHSKSHKYRSKDSPSRSSHYDTGKERSQAKKERRKWRD
ncbi:hypothetical protein SLEP1_g8469 [Rubroshorea leprosula]|uniref:SURP motif domain-containing protein n=1 Tax=Rubroshorea leprosula TaxID=152421 RepID=A0AAV5I1R5_9ROSI|nr:hypothetical protein SLEP1_g8469 [Rubroshorea leprosula]